MLDKPQDKLWQEPMHPIRIQDPPNWLNRGKKEVSTLYNTCAYIFESNHYQPCKSSGKERLSLLF